MQLDSAGTAARDTHARAYRVRLSESRLPCSRNGVRKRAARQLAASGEHRPPMAERVVPCLVWLSTVCKAHRSSLVRSICPGTWSFGTGGPYASGRAPERQPLLGRRKVVGGACVGMGCLQIRSSSAVRSPPASPVFGVPIGSMSSTWASSSAVGQCWRPRGTTKSSPGPSSMSRPGSWIVSRPARTRKKSSVSGCECQTNSPFASTSRACSR